MFDPSIIDHLRNALTIAQHDNTTDQDVDDVISYCLMTVSKIGQGSTRGRASLARVKANWEELERLVKS